MFSPARTLFALLILILPAFHVHGLEISWSKELDNNNRFGYLKILGATDNGYFFLRSNADFESYSVFSSARSRRFLLQYLSKDLRTVWEKELEPFREDAYFLDIESVGNRVLVLTYNDREQGVGYQVFATYVGTDGNYSGTPVLLEELPFSRLDDDRRPAVIFSKDRSKFAFTYRKETGTTHAICTVVSDTSLQRIYRSEWDMPMPLQRFAPTHFLLSDSADFFVLGVYFLTDKRVRQPGESHYILTGYQHQQKIPFRQDIKLEGKYLTDLSFTIDPVNQTLITAGFFSEVGMLATAGIFYQSFSLDSLKESGPFYSPFSDALLTKAITDRNDFRKKELFNYYVDRIIPRNDGGALILAESYVESSRTFWDYYTQTMVTHTYYRYGNILTASYNPKGGLLWDRLISKEQNSSDDEGFQSSYCHLISGGKLVTIFNKFIERNSSVLIVNVDGLGNVKTDVLFQESDRVSVVSKAARQVDARTILVPAYRQGDLYIAKITW